MTALVAMKDIEKSFPACARCTTLSSTCARAKSTR